MKAFRLLTIAILAGGLNHAAAVAAPAQPTDDLGLKLAHVLFTAVDVPELIREGAAKNTGSLEPFAKVRPEWKPLFLDAMNEAVVRDQPAMEAIMGRAFAKKFSTDELSTALLVFSDPQAQSAIAALSRQQALPGGAMCGEPCMRAMRSPAGRGFMAKMQTVFGPEFQGELIAAVLPDMFIIFGEKAKVAEARRSAEPQVVK